MGRTRPFLFKELGHSFSRQDDGSPATAQLSMRVRNAAPARKGGHERNGVFVLKCHPALTLPPGATGLGRTLPILFPVRTRQLLPCSNAALCPAAAARPPTPIPSGSTCSSTKTRVANTVYPLPLRTPCSTSSFSDSTVHQLPRLGPRSALHPPPWLHQAPRTSCLVR